MSTKLNFGRDKQGYNAYAPQVSTDKVSATLTNGSEQTYTVPDNYKEWVVAFSYQPGTTNWVAFNETAAVPAGATFASTTSELNPSSRYVKAGDVIHMVTESTTASVGFSFYFIGYEM